MGRIENGSNFTPERPSPKYRAKTGTSLVVNSSLIEGGGGDNLSPVTGT